MRRAFPCTCTAAALLAACLIILAATPALASSVTVYTSYGLRAALNNPKISGVFILISMVLDPVDWSTTVRLTRDVYVYGGLPDPYMVSLDFNGLVDIIQLGSGVTLELGYVELLGHMQHDGTADAYLHGMPAIDAAGSGPDASLLLYDSVSYVPVGLPMSDVRKAMNRLAQTYVTGDSSSYRFPVTVSLLNATCYTTSRIWRQPACGPGVRHFPCHCFLLWGEGGCTWRPRPLRLHGSFPALRAVVCRA